MDDPSSFARSSAKVSCTAMLMMLMMADSITAAEGTAGIWRKQYAETRRPQQLVSNDVDSAHHGTYIFDPYYAFLESEQPGELMLISDGRVRANLIPVQGSDGSYAITFTRVAEAPSGATLSFNHDRCKNFLNCFYVTGTDESFRELPSGRYVRVTKRPDNQDEQRYGSIFANRPPNFQAAQTCYDITKMSLEDFQSPGCGHNLFLQPPGTSKRYEIYSHAHQLAVPYGWKLASHAAAQGGESSKMISSAQDLIDSQKNSLGFNFSVDVLGFESSFNLNKTTTQTLENMSEKELSYSYHNNLATDHALVLDKANVLLNPVLRRAIVDLRDTGDFHAFTDAFGTHYAYATTFGAKGSLVNTYTKDQIMQLLEQGVDVKVGVSAGFKAEGIGGASAGFDSEQAKSHSQKLQRILGGGYGQFKCIGGGLTCNKGSPSAGVIVPVLLDLRPISDLLAPPFFVDKQIAINLRDRLEQHLSDSAFTNRDATASGGLVNLSIGGATCVQPGGGCPWIGAWGGPIKIRIANQEWSFDGGKGGPRKIVSLPPQSEATPISINIPNYTVGRSGTGTSGEWTNYPLPYPFPQTLNLPFDGYDETDRPWKYAFTLHARAVTGADLEEQLGMR